MSDLWGGTVILRPSGWIDIGVANTTNQIFNRSGRNIARSQYNKGWIRENIRHNIKNLFIIPRLDIVPISGGYV